MVNELFLAEVNIDLVVGLTWSLMINQKLRESLCVFYNVLIVVYLRSLALSKFVKSRQTLALKLTCQKFRDVGFVDLG